MKFVSWNVRGLRVCNNFVCSTMWDLQKMACSYRPSQGASGGLLIAWDLAEVEVWSTMSFEHVLAIHGRFLKTNEEFHVFNVYAPCDNQARKVLWEFVSGRLGPL